MKTTFELTTLSLLVSAQLGRAQTTNAPAADWKPATSNQQGKPYPQVNSEGRVRARVSAPQAQTVQLNLGDVKYPLNQAGIRSVFYDSPRTAHEGQSWRRSLYQFAPLWFQN